MNLKISDIKFLIGVLDEIEESNPSKPIANIISKKLNKMLIPQKINEEELECLACEDIPLWCYSEPEYLDIYKTAFKACYRKIKENK